MQTILCSSFAFVRIEIFSFQLERADSVENMIQYSCVRVLVQCMSRSAVYAVQSRFCCILLHCWIFGVFQSFFLSTSSLPLPPSIYLFSFTLAHTSKFVLSTRSLLYVNFEDDKDVLCYILIFNFGVLCLSVSLFLSRSRILFYVCHDCYENQCFSMNGRSVCTYKIRMWHECNEFRATKKEHRAIASFVVIFSPELRDKTCLCTKVLSRACLLCGWTTNGDAINEFKWKVAK